MKVYGIFTSVKRELKAKSLLSMASTVGTIPPLTFKPFWAQLKPTRRAGMR